MPKSPQEVASKWSRNLTNSTEAIRQGVDSTTVAPSQKAIAAIDRMVAGVQRAAADGSIKRGLERVSLSDWQSAMLNKGLQRIAGGAAAAQPKVEAFMAEWLPYEEAGVRKLESMPRGDLEQNIGRAVEMMRHNSQFKRRS